MPLARFDVLWFETDPAVFTLLTIPGCLLHLPPFCYGYNYGIGLPNRQSKIRQMPLLEQSAKYYSRQNFRLYGMSVGVWGVDLVWARGRWVLCWQGCVGGCGVLCMRLVHVVCLILLAELLFNWPPVRPLPHCFHVRRWPKPSPNSLSTETDSGMYTFFHTIATYVYFSS